MVTEDAIARNATPLEELDDRSLLRFAHRGHQQAARAFVDRYVGGIHAFVHARLGSTLALEKTVDIFAATVSSLEGGSFVDSSAARALHEQAIASIILQDQPIHDQRLDRLADVLAAESLVAPPAPPDVAAAATATVIEATPAVAESVFDGQTSSHTRPHREPGPRDEVRGPVAPVPPLPQPHVVPAKPGADARLIVLLVLVALIAVVGSVLLFGDPDAIRDLLPTMQGGLPGASALV